MNEVLLYNFFGTIQGQMIIIISLFLLTLSMMFIGGDIINRKTKDERKADHFVHMTKTKGERKVELFVSRCAWIFTILLILDTILFIKYSKQPSIDNPKYYTVINVPVKRYSIKSNQFETTSGQIINKAIVLKNSLITASSTTVELKEYKLKKKWLGIQDAPKIIYKANIVLPAKDAKKVENKQAN